MDWICPLDADGPRLQRSQERQGERAQGVSLGDRGGEPVDSLSRAAVQGRSLVHIFHPDAFILRKMFKCTFFRPLDSLLSGEILRNVPRISAVPVGFLSRFRARKIPGCLLAAFSSLLPLSLTRAQAA